MDSSKLSFSFDVLELGQKLEESLSNNLTGYWQIQFTEKSQAPLQSPWLIGVIQGRIICSGTEKLQWPMLNKILQRFIKPLRTPQSQQTILTLLTDTPVSRSALLGRLMIQLEDIKLFSHNDALSAIRLSILNDLDHYLFKYSGQAQFIPDDDLLVSAPIRGFDWGSLLIDVGKRQEQWGPLKGLGFLPTSMITLNHEALEASNLPDQQKKQLKNLVNQGRQLDEIAYLMAKDPLDVAKILAQLSQMGLIVAKLKETVVSGTTAVANQLHEVFIVDDSPVLVRQFQHLVTRWGYQVNSTNNALAAVETMQRYSPSVIFLDINMPGASGFELIKQIRRLPELTNVPMVLLTAEKTVSNQFRAQWASCKFLAKPLTRNAVPAFEKELYNLLQELAPIAG